MSLARVALRASFLALLFLTPAAQSTGGAEVIPGRPGTAPPDEVGVPGTLGTRPDGAPFVADAHQGGSARALHLVDLRWGRLVEVLGLDGAGEIDPRPVLRDFVVGQDVVDDGINYRLVDNIDVGTERLVILRQPGAPEPSIGAGTFEELLLAAETNLSVVAPRDPSGPPPFSTVVRNAALVARFDDLLRDGSEENQALYTSLRLALPGSPFVARARLLFDPNHGGIRRGRFHSTRILIDPTIDELDFREIPVPLPINLGGLPEGPDGPQANLTVRIPSQPDPGQGIFIVPTNLRGRSLSTTGNGPVDLASPTMDVIRGLRTGHRNDPSRGYLFDDQPPALVGDFLATLDTATDDPAGEAGFAFRVDMTFTTPCWLRPVQGNVVRALDASLEVVENATGVTPSGQVLGLRVRKLGRQPVTAGELVGPVRFLSQYRPAAFPSICWARFAHVTSGAPPGTLVRLDNEVILRFSEGMDRASISAFDSFRIVRGDGSQPTEPHEIVVGSAGGAQGGMQVENTPLLPFDHVNGEATPYHVELRPGPFELTDLAGNPLETFPTGMVFTLDPGAGTLSNGGVALAFQSFDELPGAGASDLRGNVFLDLARGSVRPRPVSAFSIAADADKPVPSLMIPFGPGVKGPLSPLGSRLQTVWRYADLGWSVHDETKVDVDVIGLSWAPVGGSVVSDFFPEFEIRLAHASRQPDEDIDGNLLPRYPASGLARTEPFEANVLQDPLGPQTVVHPRGLGYQIDPADLYSGQSGRTMAPFPLNRGAGPLVSYTWRDTAVRAQGGPNGAGAPMGIEVGAPLFLEPATGTLAGPDEVPSIALPLLMEFRCFPTTVGLGINSMAVALALNSSSLPSFRVHSTGGINAQGGVVVVNPDLETTPSGGFNPVNGFPTPPGDNAFTIGQVDLVTRISRAHTVWVDTSAFAPDYLAPVSELDLPPGTALMVEVRGADGFNGGAADPFDAADLDAYGELDGTEVLFHGGQSGWSSNWNAIDGARYFQVRLTFVGNLDSGATAVLEGLGIAFLR
jgi:hypothetical protein